MAQLGNASFFTSFEATTENRPNIIPNIKPNIGPINIIANRGCMAKYGGKPAPIDATCG